MMKYFVVWLCLLAVVIAVEGVKQPVEDDDDKRLKFDVEDECVGSSVTPCHKRRLLDLDPPQKKKRAKAAAQAAAPADAVALRKLLQLKYLAGQAGRAQHEQVAVAFDPLDPRVINWPGDPQPVKDYCKVLNPEYPCNARRLLSQGGKRRKLLDDFLQTNKDTGTSAEMQVGRQKELEGDDTEVNNP